MKRTSILLALVISLAACQDSEKPKKSSVRLGPDTGSPSEEIHPGYEIYLDNCSVCHGKEGDAGRGVQPTCKPPSSIALVYIR
ncbi:hypothetical protein KFE98_06505 [bacterium SCSIO 12741]|nr:hypothetical protein KFE98_06505 [bacterium SCSIO 12741]